MSLKSARFRLAVVLDAALEGWTSMDYVGEMLVSSLRRERAEDVEVSTLQPWTPRLFGNVSGPARQARINIDRVIARCAAYPMAVALRRWQFNAFHIVDHSYAHAAYALPWQRTGIYCHDLDALRPLLSPAASSAAQRWLARSVLRSLQRVAVVFYSTAQVGRQIIERGLVDEKKLIIAPYGVAPEFTATGSPTAELDDILPIGRFILNVGSADPRKRLDLLFRAFAAVRAEEPNLFLVQQGADLSRKHQALIDGLGIRSVLVKLPRISRKTLADLYRRASLVVLPSEREGFGLPLIEALACGTAVLASDIPAFREVGGEAAAYCGASDPAGWASAILGALPHEEQMDSRGVRLRQASRFSWSRHAETILSAYEDLA